MKIGVAIAVLALTGSVFMNAIAQNVETAKEKAKVVAEKAKDSVGCPMHPGVKADKDGKCPKCGMAMEKKPGAHAKHAMKHAGGKATEDCAKGCEGKMSEDCKKNCEGKSKEECAKECAKKGAKSGDAGCCAGKK
jgi:hypothetical protein